jgi:hypothetical protein
MTTKTKRRETKRIESFHFRSIDDETSGGVYREAGEMNRGRERTTPSLRQLRNTEIKMRERGHVRDEGGEISESRSNTI